MKYNKQPLDIPVLLAMLKARGPAIGDEQEAGRILGIVSYFRLANYLRPMEAKNEDFSRQAKRQADYFHFVFICESQKSLGRYLFKVVYYCRLELDGKSTLLRRSNQPFGTYKALAASLHLQNKTY